MSCRQNLKCCWTFCRSKSCHLKSYPMCCCQNSKCCWTCRPLEEPAPELLELEEL